jgi:hypothetical protein
MGWAFRWEWIDKEFIDLKNCGWETCWRNPLWRQRTRWVDNIKMDLNRFYAAKMDGTGLGSVAALVLAVLNPWVLLPIK